MLQLVKLKSPKLGDMVRFPVGTCGLSSLVFCVGGWV